MIFSPLARPDPWTARAGLLAALLVAAAAASAGCGQRACIEWSTQEGMCPAAASVIGEHLGKCTNITAVNGEATREDNLCCYPVTKQGPLPNCFVETTSSGPPPPDTMSGTPICDNQGQCGRFANSGCTACALNDLCINQALQCQSTTACNDILTCATSCAESDLQCRQQCEALNPDGLNDFHAFLQCVYCQECRSDCSSHQAECVDPQTTGMGGAGGFAATSGMGGFGGMGGMGGKGGAGGK